MKEIQISKKTFFIVIITTIALILGICSIVIFTERDILFPKAYEPITEIKLNNLGSAERIEGNVAIVSIFVNDKKNKWDFRLENDKKIRSDLLCYIEVASEWLYSQAGKYDKDIKLFFADSPQSDLYYEATLDDDFGETKNREDKYHINQCEYIENNVPTEKLKQKYDCKSVVYLFFVNSIVEEDYSAYAIQYYAEEREYPFEMCFLPTKFCNTVVSPSVIIHEILHCFGAPDLYVADISNNNYNTTNEFVAYCEENVPNDIMLTTFSLIDGEKQKVFDRITNEITEITAYYIGWLDTAPAWVDEYGLVHNQFENYNG